MKRRVTAVSATLSLLLACAAIAEQHTDKAATAPSQAAFFNKCVGTWDATVTAGGETSKGTETVRTLGDGTFLISDFEGTMADGPFKGHGVTGYDPQRKKYVGVWIDTMSPMPMHMEGVLDAAGKVMTATAEMPDHTAPGKTVKATMTETWVDANTRNWTMSVPGPDGKSMETMQISYKRRK